MKKKKKNKEYLWIDAINEQLETLTSDEDPAAKAMKFVLMYFGMSFTIGLLGMYIIFWIASC